jgi:hypothetical protein
MALTQSTLPGIIDRRTFLKAFGAFSTQALVARPALTAPWLPAQVTIPPSLMLHSVDGRDDFLPRLLEQLNEKGYTGTTYQQWQQRLAANQPIANPIIISVDDISLACQACARYDTFVQMKGWFKAAGMTAVYGVITEPVIGDAPQRQQDEARWELMQAWVEEGFELASHTSYHSNFNALDSGPRPDFEATDYEAEICRSAALIEQKLAERGIDYRVRTLILPFGSGYSYRLPDPQIHQGIAAACRQTNIQFVVGIPQGRGPLPLAALAGTTTLTYVGRLAPVYSADGGDQPLPIADLTLAALEAWRENNDRFASQPARLAL